MSASHDHPVDALAAYALDAAAAVREMDPRDRAALEAHLAACPECRAELADLRKVVAGIGLNVPLEDPPSGLKARILESVMSSNEVPGTHARPAARVPRARGAMLPWLVAAASFALALASGALAWSANQRAKMFEGEADRLNGQVNLLDTAVKDLVVRQAVMTAPDMVAVRLAGQPDAPAARAQAFVSKTHGLVFTADHLPALDAGKTYQLWVVTKTAPVSIGVFVANADGVAVRLMGVPAAATQSPVAVAVTIEPAGGVAAPTGPKVLVGRLSPQ